MTESVRRGGLPVRFSSDSRRGNPARRGIITQRGPLADAIAGYSIAGAHAGGAISG